MDVTQALRDAENALRDFVAAELGQRLGPNWLNDCGVSADRLAKWKERKEAEEKRQEAGVVEERLLYYADFYDLKTILNKHWSSFAPALGDWKTFEVYLTELERLRDPDAHRRELLPHQKHLVLGIAGEIRNRIVRHRSKGETADDYFPRIESARDSLGNIWVPRGDLDTKGVITKIALRPGDRLEFTITATDPEGLPLDYGIEVGGGSAKWQDSQEFQVAIQDKDVSTGFMVSLMVRGRRAYHAESYCDDKVRFFYQVLPRRATA